MKFLLSNTQLFRGIGESEIDSSHVSSSICVEGQFTR